MVELIPAIYILYPWISCGYINIYGIWYSKLEKNVAKEKIDKIGIEIAKQQIENMQHVPKAWSETENRQ